MYIFWHFSALYSSLVFMVDRQLFSAIIILALHALYFFSFGEFRAREGTTGDHPTADSFVQVTRGEFIKFLFLSFER